MRIRHGLAEQQTVQMIRTQLEADRLEFFYPMIELARLDDEYDMIQNIRLQV